jgi:hypothetical protein
VYIKSRHLIVTIFLLWMLPTTIIVEPGAPRPEFTQELLVLRPVILEAAHRHNLPNISKMSDSDFAVVMALILYNEDLGSFEEEVRPLRAITSIRRDTEIDINELLGSNLSIRPSNIRPSVAYEMLQHQLPVAPPANTITIPVSIFGSKLTNRTQLSEQDLYRAITSEIAQPDKAVEYLAANLERGMYRAQYEGVSVNRDTLLAWHIRGIVAPRDIRNNRDAYNYTHRLTYLQYACKLIYPNSRSSDSRMCRFTDEESVVRR